jgi:hypothetical protein
MIPYYVGVFGPRIGVQILVIATAIRIGVMLVVIFALEIVLVICKSENEILLWR